MCASSYGLPQHPEVLKPFCAAFLELGKMLPLRSISEHLHSHPHGFNARSDANGVLANIEQGTLCGASAELAVGIEGNLAPKSDVAGRGLSWMSKLQTSRFIAASTGLDPQGCSMSWAGSRCSL